MYNVIFLKKIFQIYLDDAGGDRSWVDNEFCKNFVDNIITSLNTKPITVQLPEPTGRPEQQEDDIPELRINLGDQLESITPMPRYINPLIILPFHI